jgi:hypothetical protein
MSNSLFISVLIILLPIYPAFGAILYDGSRRSEMGDINLSTIINTEDDFINDASLSTDIPLDTGSDLPNRNAIVTYEVQSGDNLIDIAADFKLSEHSPLVNKPNQYYPSRAEAHHTSRDGLSIQFKKMTPSILSLQIQDNLRGYPYK